MSKRKLIFHKETLRLLSQRNLADVNAAGSTKICGSMSAYNDACSTNVETACNDCTVVCTAQSEICLTVYCF